VLVCGGAAGSGVAPTSLPNPRQLTTACHHRKYARAALLTDPWQRLVTSMAITAAAVICPRERAAAL
jgi:hypothetical protein